MEPNKLRVVESIFNSIKKEGGHIKITKTLSYGGEKSFNVISLKEDGSIIYNFRGSNNKSSKIISMAESALGAIEEAIKENKFL